MSRKRPARPSRFARLQWQLARSFVVASLGVSFAILAFLLTLVLIAFFLTPLLSWALATEGEERIAPRIAELLTPARRSELPEYLAGLCGSLRQKGDTAANASYFSFSLSLDKHRGHRMLVAVTDTNGRIIADHSLNTEAPLPGSLLTNSLRPEERPAMQAALRGVTDVDQIALRSGDGSTVAFVPLQREGKRVGAFYLRLFVPFDLPLIFRTLGEHSLQIGATVFAATLLPAIIGGYFGSRSLTRRLAVIGNVAEAWGHGDFTRTVPESDRDEMGQFGRRLNSIRSELEETMRLRQRLAGLEERHRIARDLHDTVKQEMFALTMQLSALESFLQSGQRPTEPDQLATVLRARVADVERMAHRVQQELTGVIRELSPPATTAIRTETHPLPLSVSLRQMTENWSRQCGIAAQFSLDGDPVLTSEECAEISRIVREALANIARHSGASQATVLLLHDTPPDHWLLLIRDNGCGFAIDDVRDGEGMGLRNMRERAGYLREGRCALHSRPGDGTCIEIYFQAEVQ